MSRNGLLIDYEFCTGCHSCEAACKKELNLPAGKFGIKLAKNGPFKLNEVDDKWELTYVPVPTQLCNLCGDRVASGKKPNCVQHCQASVIEYGPVEELAVKLNNKARQVLFIP
ncbi:MAG: 4Fe-4S ferredoxin iron-sulfur binding domain protein [Firmicutes bacterium]|nr:4Fe-4S ferredoxin iron-sulfur binding domain protein [Bacillota bacterium]